MTDTHEAVRLAGRLDSWARNYSTTDYTDDMATKAASFLRRIPELEAEVQEQARLNGMGAERELALRAQVARLEAENAAWREHAETLTHQVICCGVAVSHPDPDLTKHGAYAGKWNSAQAEEVRKLRAERDRLRAIAEGRASGCQCGDDDVCKIAKERDQLRAELENVRVPEGWSIYQNGDGSIQATMPNGDKWHFKQNHRPGETAWFAYRLLSALLAATPTPPAQATQLPESVSRDEMLKYYSDHANVQATEALRYQARIRILEAALAQHPAQAAADAQDAERLPYRKEFATLPPMPWVRRNIGGLIEVVDADGNPVLPWLAFDAAAPGGRSTFNKRNNIALFIAEMTKLYVEEVQS